MIGQRFTSPHLLFAAIATQPLLLHAKLDGFHRISDFDR